MAIFNNMDGLDNKFLHNIDLESLSKETGLSYKELAELAKIGPKVVYKWHYSHKDSSRPDYNALVRLFQHGATVETLFGVDYAATHQPASVLPPEFVKANPEVIEGFREQLMEDLMKKDLVPKDQVKNIVRQEIERLFPSAKPAIVDLKNKGLI